MEENKDNELERLRKENEELKKRVEELERNAIPLDMNLDGIDWHKAFELYEKFMAATRPPDKWGK